MKKQKQGCSHLKTTLPFKGGRQGPGSPCACCPDDETGAGVGEDSSHRTCSQVRLKSTSDVIRIHLGGIFQWLVSRKLLSPPHPFFWVGGKLVFNRDSDLGLDTQRPASLPGQTPFLLLALSFLIRRWTGFPKSPPSKCGEGGGEESNF